MLLIKYRVLLLCNNHFELARESFEAEIVGDMLCAVVCHF